jgi:hypothetical protein
MSKVKLGFTAMSVAKKIQVTRSIIAAMTGNTNFKTPSPTLAVITAAVNTLEKAFEDAQDGGISKTSVMRTATIALSGLMTQLTAYVQVASGGDKDIILSSGMQVKASSSPSQILAAPINVIATTSTIEGEIILKWKRVPKAAVYVVQQSADGTTNWIPAGNCTKSTITEQGLVSGSKNWFRVAGVGPKGQGPWSAPARGMAG